MNRAIRTLAVLGSGGMTLGVLQAFDMISFANAIARFLATFLSLIVTVLLGGDPGNLLSDGGAAINLIDGALPHEHGV
jgi:hypothetical protein